MKIFIIFILAIVISACGPSEEQIKEEIDLLYSEIKLIPINDPCSNLKGYESLQKMENEKGTTYYIDITKQKIETYSDLCNQKIESEKTGDWTIVNYVDDFGELTGDKGLNLRAKGSFSNSATTNSSLSVLFSWSLKDGYLPLFYLYEYDWSPVKGVYSDSSNNTMECRFRDSGGDTRRMDLYQRRGDDYLYAHDNKVSVRDYLNENTKIFKNLVREGDKVMFVCERDYSDVYKFTLDFKYAKNAKRKLNE